MQNDEIIFIHYSAFCIPHFGDGRMRGTVITITSGKGGVGKTTATANIAAGLASDGAKVVCIDADIGLRNLDVGMGLENRIVYDLVHIVEGSARCEPDRKR